MSEPKTGFETFADVLKNMTPEHREKLITSHQKFGKLRGFCKAKGYIDVLENLTGIHVLENTKEVKEIRELLDFLKPGKFKWTYEDKTLQKAWAKVEEEREKK